MKLFEFLIYLLSAQAQTLERLAAFLGEDELFQILELAGENEEMSSRSSILNKDWFEESKTWDDASAYLQIEGSVREFNLSARLEFHLWAYPHYRSIIESPIDLNSELHLSNGHAGEEIIHQALSEAKIWILSLPLSPDLSRQAEKIALSPWIRFRTGMLKKIGKRPFASV